MRKYFKYNDGYINIDDSNIYLTTSGNWQETRELSEKSQLSKIQDQKKVNQKQGYFFTFYIAILVFMSFLVDTEKLIIIAAFLGVGLFFLFYYFRKDSGRQYKIPLAKLRSIQILENDSVKLNFSNAIDENDCEILNNVDEAGISYLLNISPE